MLKKAIVGLVLLICLAIAANAQKLPKTAVILDSAKVTSEREMILWMESPRKTPRDPEDEIYTCPDNSRGHYYTGVTYVSLVDLRTLQILQTLELISDGAESGYNVFDLPYLIKRTGYYDVPKLDQNKEGKPRLMKLQDFNGDGKAYEFALFDAIACMGLETTLVGYSPKRDQVIQYEVELTTDEGTGKTVWVDYFYGQKPNKLGVYKYQIDYRGRGGALEKYEIRYDAKKEMFVGRRTSIYDEKPDVIQEKERPSK